MIMSSDFLWRSFWSFSKKHTASYDGTIQVNLRPILISPKMTYCIKISYYLKAMILVVQMIISLWNWTDVSAAMQSSSSKQKFHGFETLQDLMIRCHIIYWKGLWIHLGSCKLQNHFIYHWNSATSVKISPALLNNVKMCLKSLIACENLKILSDFVDSTGPNGLVLFGAGSCASMVQCSAVNAVNFLTNIHKRHLIAHLLGRGMQCLLWIQHLIDILSQIL